MSAAELHGLSWREDAEDIRSYRRTVAKAALGKHEFSWFRERLPPVVTEALCWDEFEDGAYDEDVFQIPSEPKLEGGTYEQVRDALDDAAEQAEQYDERTGYWKQGGPLYDRVYEQTVDEVREEMEQVANAIDDYRDELRSWWRVTDAWLDAEEDAVERMYTINPFEADREEKRLERRKRHHAARDPDLLDARYPAYRIGRDIHEITGGNNPVDAGKHDMAMFGCAKGGSLTGLGAMALGEPVLGVAIAVGGPLLAVVPWITKNATLDAHRTVRAEYRVEEMDRVLADPVVDTVERRGSVGDH